MTVLKKSSYFINESGFVLPSISFLIFILFIVFLGNLFIYEIEIKMFAHNLELLKIDTLIQMSIESYKNDLLHSDDFITSTNYQFPYGMAMITAQENVMDQYIALHLKIKTEQNQQYFAEFTIPSINKE